MEDNKLIAEFMGVHDDILSTGNVHSWSDAPFFYITEDSKEKVMEGITKYSKYHESWDWLMPAVTKIAPLTEHGIKIENYETIQSAYSFVVEFIKEYNDEK
tara:strand:+ start:56 stop:358 length:303 start_codon:yes stop_codon:yes gene_type:complete